MICPFFTPTAPVISGFLVLTSETSFSLTVTLMDTSFLPRSPKSLPCDWSRTSTSTSSLEVLSFLRADSKASSTVLPLVTIDLIPLTYPAF